MTDLVERQAVLDIIHRFFTEEVDKIPTKKTEDGEVYVIHKCQPLFAMNKAICKRIKALQAVNPQEPKMGHWIMDSDEEHGHCDQCGNKTDLVDGDYHNFCRKCGAKMIEP